MTTKTLLSTDAFGKLLGAHATLTRELSATLLSSHGLTINDYGCLLLLSRAGEEGMRRIDLANSLNLSPSGITRLLDRLEDQGLVGKGECKSDARVSYAILTRELSASLVAQHGLTINDYGCLLLLSRAGEEGMRRIDLANELRLSPSGITRLLDRLVDQGLVGKGACKEDARVSYAILTDAGLAKIKDAWPEHVDAVERRVSAVLSDEEIKTLHELLARLSETDESCSPED